MSASKNQPQKVDPRTEKLGHKVQFTLEREDGTPQEFKYASKSQAIVDLKKNHGLTCSEISRVLGIRYQFAYNVLKRTKNL